MRSPAPRRGPRVRGAAAALVSLVLVSLVLGLAASRAGAAPAWIYRGLVLPRGAVALDLGLGLGHAPLDANRSRTGFGLNLELAAGIASELELGVRTGVRVDPDGQATRADGFGRPFETETYGTGGDRVANPELRLRWEVARGSVAHLGLEGRAYLPFEARTSFGLMFGLPLSLRLGSVRFDTGLYVPVIFDTPRHTVISVPLHVWIQASQTLWLGPLLGLRIVSESPGGSHDEYPFGFGLGSALSHAVDLRAWFVFPDLSRTQAARTFGAGLALQLRFE